MTDDTPGPATAGVPAAPPDGRGPAPTTGEPARPPVVLLAVTAGVVVANLYYAQPLLAAIGDDLRAAPARVALVATLTQLGYAAGLLLVVPLADVAERRRLIVTLSLLAAAFLAAASQATTVEWLLVASLGIGVASVVPQVVIPVAATLAPAATRGRVVGTVMSGLLIGILLARVVSGAAGARFGWRAVFVGAAAAMAVLALVLRLRLPASRPESTLGYGALLRSLPGLVRRHAPLRTAAVVSGCAFASFSVFWTTLVFHLAAPPLGLGSAAAGAFGLVGAVGALGASAMGRFADRGRPGRAVGIGLVVGIAGWATFAVAGRSLAGLVVGVIVLDLGMQATHVPNQAIVFALDEQARGRLNAAYMVTCFLGAALGSALGAQAWARGGWNAVTATGSALLLVAVGVRALAGRGMGAARAPVSPGR